MKILIVNFHYNLIMPNTGAIVYIVIFGTAMYRDFFVLFSALVYWNFFET